MTLAAIEESKQFVGTLTFGTGVGAKSFEKQVTECSLVPSVENGESADRVETLGGQVIEGSTSESYTWALNLGLIQDFLDAQGLVEYLRANAGTEVDFSWEPNSAATGGPTYTGTVKLRPTTIGGGIRVRLTSSVELPCVGEPDVTYA